MFRDKEEGSIYVAAFTSKAHQLQIPAAPHSAHLQGLLAFKLCPSSRAPCILHRPFKIIHVYVMMVSRGAGPLTVPPTAPAS
eukprot:1158471-Pelagomonas_calceolata.AAC.7